MNRNKFKTFVIVIFLLGVLFLLSGCKKDDTKKNNGGDTGGDKQVTLIWWNLFESEDNVKPLIETFQKDNKNVVIQYKQQGVEGGVSAYKNLLDNALSDQDTINDPDIFTIENTWVGKYKDFLSPAPSSVVSSSELEDFYPVVQSDFGKDSVLGLPLYVDTLAVIYNKDKLIEEGYSTPASEWGEFQQQAFNLTKRDSSGNIVSAGLSAASGGNVQFNFDIISLLMLQNGADLNDSSVLSSFTENTEVQDSFLFYKMFSDRGGSWDDKQKLDIASFLEGKLAMYIGPSWRLNDILIYNEEYNLNLNIGVAPLPQLSGTDTTHWGTYWGQVVAKSSPNTEMAWKFIKFITEAEQLRILDQKVKENGRKVGVFYPRISMSSDISNDPNLRVFSQEITFAKNWNMYDGFELEEEFNKAFDEKQFDLNKFGEIVSKSVR